jgi:hypothetical protein
MFNTDLIDILNWAHSLIGIKYTWVFSDKYIDGFNPIPIYGINKLPPIDYIQKNGCNCVGLINLIRLKLNKNIPKYNNNSGIRNYSGCISCWTNELNKINALQVFDSKKDYEIGTLLIKKYNKYLPGHIAIIIGHNKILHSYSNNYSTDTLTDPGITISNLNDFCQQLNFDNKPFFDFTCVPNIWLFKDF